MQVGCGQEQDLKTAKAAVWAMARMVRSLVFFPFLHTKKPPKMIIVCGTTSAGEAEVGAFCLAAYGESW